MSGGADDLNKDYVAAGFGGVLKPGKSPALILIDFARAYFDQNCGLYAGVDNRLRFNPGAVGASVITAGAYVQVTLTRDAGGIVTGYVGGIQQFQFTDTNNDAVIDANNRLRIFQDNLSGGVTGEASAGSIARLRLYGRALGADEIAGLDREPSSVQFSAASYSVGEGAGATTVTVTRAGNTTLPAAVDYTTSDETASQKFDYTLAAGTLLFELLREAGKGAANNLLQCLQSGSDGATF